MAPTNADPGGPPGDAATTRPAPATWGESRWPPTIALALGIVLLLALPRRLDAGPPWLIPAIEIAVALFLAINEPDREVEERWHRNLSIGLIALLTLANITSVGLLVHELLVPGNQIEGQLLVRSAIVVWTTNVISFGLWYWELDGGGPVGRRNVERPERDFFFPQMTQDLRPFTPVGWFPRFVDYLYVSYTNATAFSPTDTMPLTPWAKALMTLQSATALVTLAVLAARAINILS